MKKLFTVICLCMLCVLCACSDEQETATESDYVLYYKNSSETNLVAVPYELEAQTMEAQIDELILALELRPDDQTLKKAKPDDVVIADHFFGEDGQLILSFDSAYSNLDLVSEILCRAAIVKTLCQIDGVDYVEFYVNGQTLMLSGEIPVGQMENSDFIDNTGKYTAFGQTTTITVYFADATGELLNDIQLVVDSSGTVSIEQLIVEQLIAGPNESASNVYPVMPEGTKLNRVTTRDNTCYIDFSAEFMNKREEISDDVAVFSVVNSLCELSTVSRVMLTVDGETPRNYPGIDFTTTLERKLELITE